MEKLSREHSTSRNYKSLSNHPIALKKYLRDAKVKMDRRKYMSSKTIMTVVSIHGYHKVIWNMEINSNYAWKSLDGKRANSRYYSLTSVD